MHTGIISGWVFLLLTILSSASIAIMMKIFRREEGNRYGIILGNYLMCVVIGFFMQGSHTWVLRPDATTLLCGVTGGVFYVAGFVCMQESIGTNGAILSSAFGRLGLVVPLIASIFLFSERPSLIQVIGLLLVLTAVIVISGYKEEPEKPGTVRPLLLLCVLLFCGLADTMSKIFEHVGSREMDELFILLIFASAAVITGFLAFFEYRRTRRSLHAADLFFGVAVGIPNYFSSMLLLKALAAIPAIIAYPCYSTGTIVVVMLAGALWLHEHPGKRQWLGLLLILTALVLLNLNV